MAAEARSRWSTILGGIPATAPNVATHPNATLDAQAARYMAARHSVLQLDLAIQKTNGDFKATLADIERHYNEQVDNVETEYKAKSADLNEKYGAAYDALMREQKAFAEMLKGVDCRAEFVNHFPVPKDEQESES